MSDGLRARTPLDVHEACVSLVKEEGGGSFFSRSNWRARLDSLAAPAARRTTIETAAEQQTAIDEELDRAREELNARLRGNHVQHVCLPWGVSGEKTASALGRLGFRTAFANRFPGQFAVRPGDQPFWLKRL